MSCFIMDTRATAAVADGIAKALNMGFEFLGLEAPESLREALKDCADKYGYFDTAKIFGKLYGLNYWAFRERYEGRHLEGIEETQDMPTVPAVLHRVGYANYHYTVTPAHFQYIKQLECLIYQCDEGKAAKTELFKGLRDFRNAWFAFLVHNNEDWQAAGWGEV